jgi:hypothetical protein
MTHGPNLWTILWFIFFAGATAGSAIVLITLYLSNRS